MNAEPIFNFSTRHQQARRFMYQDKLGHVRVGLNHQLSTPEEAAELDWIVRIKGQHVPAPRETVVKDWQTIAYRRKDGPKGKVGNHQDQAKLTKVRFTDKGLNDTFQADCEAAYKMLRGASYFGEQFNRLPGGAQIALFDLYLFGGLTVEIAQAVDRRDFAEAATQVYMPYEVRRVGELQALFMSCSGKKGLQPMKCSAQHVSHLWQTQGMTGSEHDLCLACGATGEGIGGEASPGASQPCPGARQ